jgi:hypothetical protein
MEGPPVGLTGLLEASEGTAACAESRPTLSSLHCRCLHCGCLEFLVALRGSERLPRREEKRVLFLPTHPANSSDERDTMAYLTAQYGKDVDKGDRLFLQTQTDPPY